MAPIKEAVYATLLMNDAYLPGAMVLGHSLKDKGAKARLVVLAVLENLSASTITELRTVYDEIIAVNRIVNKHPANLYLMDRPDLISTFTKIELWRQTQFRQIVYIDADMVAVRAPNELLNYDADFAAVPDIGWPDCFNSGLLVLRPNLGDYYSLLALAQRGISFDGADQGLLNMHFQDWQRLSFTYNCTPSASYQYVPAYKHFQSSISLLHFIGREKPWTLGRDHGHTSAVYSELLGRWWSTYDKHYRAHTSYYSGENRVAPRIVQGYVAGEKTTSFLGYSFVESQPRLPPTPALNLQLPETATATTEAAMTDRPEPVEQMDQQESEPLPTLEQRRVIAPQIQWDASRAPPPTGSRPEASNLPTQIYEFNQDTKLFQPPKYPEAPKDMYYQVPPKSNNIEQLKPVFPWEAYAPKPTRVFPDEQPPIPQQDANFSRDPQSGPESGPISTVRTSSDVSEGSEATKASTPSSVSDIDPWSSYSRTNAWDAMPEIERYVQAFSQVRRGKVQVIHQANPATGTAGPLISPSGDGGRRPSMRLTDFPTEWERPSLPVTPAPRRPSFWGEEREEAAELAAAEGVPKQQDWVSRPSLYSRLEFGSAAAAAESACRSVPLPTLSWRCQYCGKQNPIQKLEELQRHQAEVLQKGPELKPRDLPQRAMPGAAVDMTAAVATEVSSPGKPAENEVGKDEPAVGTDTAPRAAKVKATANTTSAAKPKSILKEPSFELGGLRSGGTASNSQEVPPEAVAEDIQTSA